jgi:thiol-disulfide isomerase/thioredoxin
MTQIEDQCTKDIDNTNVALDLHISREGATIKLQTFMPLYSNLSDEMKETKAGEYLAKKIEAARKASIGQPIENFKLPNLDGQMVEVASLKGKYVLVDFWASWCGPCRAENPFLKEAYAKYKPKNFEIVGISLDDKRDKWVAAIEKDGLPWIHVSDLKGWKNVAALSYGITAIPQNFLVDTNGVIIAQNLRGEALAKKLEEIIQ